MTPALARLLAEVKGRGLSWDSVSGDFRIPLTEAERDALVAAVPTWQAIETHPHNRPVLVFYKNALGNGRRVRATYYDAGTLNMDEDATEEHADEGGMNLHPGWFEETEACEVLMPLEAPPTHWMYLPPSPEDTETQP